MGQSMDTLLQGVAVGAPVVAGGLQARGIREQAEAQAGASQYNARLAELTARENAARIRREGHRAVTSDLVRKANSGLQLSGSPLMALADEAAEVERKAVDELVAGRNTAALDRGQARNTIRAARTAQGASLLTGGLNAVGAAYDTGLFRRRT